MAKRSLLIRGGAVVSGESVSRLDVLIIGEEIENLGDLAGRTADEVIDPQGLLVLSGAVDTHVHYGHDS